MPPSSSKSKVAPTKCPVWIYGPQVSHLNASYGLGGETWVRVYETCKQKLAEMYGDLTPEYIWQCAAKERRTEMITKIYAKLKAAQTILDVLLIYSALINALGLVLSNKAKIEASSASFSGTVTNIHSFYDHLYEYTEEILADPVSMETFVTPDDFKKLYDARHSRRKNIVINIGRDELVNSIKLQEARDPNTSPRYVHPIKKEMSKCANTLVTDCTLMFAGIKNKLFKPLADVIACHCSFFKHKLVKIKDPGYTFRNVKHANKISDDDYAFFSNSHRTYFTQLKPLLIRKYRESDNTCAKKTYLSQLFGNCCSVLYKPLYITPKTYKPEDILVAAKENILIANTGCRPFSMGQLSVFGTSILRNNSIAERCNIPVFFIVEEAGQQARIYEDYYSGPSRQFFNDTIKELLDKKVFIPSSTYFNNQRYELNTKFDINTLPCYSELSEHVKTAEFKSKVTKYFYIFVGSLIHFAVVNNIELPFKLSRVYILQLFNIINFLEVDENNTLKILLPENLETQLLLISLYLLEKASSTYTKQILEIFEDPQKLLTDEMLIQSLDIDLDDEDAETRSKGIRMNGYCTINDTNSPIYSENKETLFLNMVELLYKTALKHYFEDINSTMAVNSDFKMNQHLLNFFGGYKNYKNYESPQLHRLELPALNVLAFKQKLAVVRKVDIFLSGFGVTYDIIKDGLIPLLRISAFTPGMAEDKSPLYLFNDNGEFLPSYITDTSISATDENALYKQMIQRIKRNEDLRLIDSGTVFKVSVMFKLYRILLNRGADISRDFIGMYNKKFYNFESSDNYGNMTDEDYHNEFVKLLLKAWSGSPTINSNGYRVSFPLVNRKLPATHTCFNRLDINKTYITTAELYKDLVILTTEGTNFGELLLVGGKKK